MTRRLLLVTLVLALLTLPTLATVSAYDAGGPLPAGAAEVETWKWDGSAWVSQGTGSVTADARAWTSGPTQGSCNKENWNVDVAAHASVAQWIDWTLSGTRWDWRVRKPGTYAADCITFTVASNNDVEIDYQDFGDLTSAASVNQTIETYYAFGPTINGLLGGGWVRASALNSDDDLLLDSGDLHAGISVKLWIKIVVVNCNSSCEYHATGKITIRLKNIKVWIDPVTGNFL